MKPTAKFFVVCFCYPFFLGGGGGYPAQNPAKYKTWLCVLVQLTNSSIAIM